MKETCNVEKCDLAPEIDGLCQGHWEYAIRLADEAWKRDEDYGTDY